MIEEYKNKGTDSALSMRAEYIFLAFTYVHLVT